MRKISPEVRKALEAEPQVCARRREGGCAGRITWEHALTYAGRQVDEVWAIIKLCECHHSVNTYQDGGLLDKEINVWIALNRATDEELKKYDKTDFIGLRDRLNNKLLQAKTKGI